MSSSTKVGLNPAHQPIFSNKAKIGIGGGLIIAVGVIAVGILAKLDKLGLKLPNGFNQDAALGTSFAPLGIMLLGVGANKFLHWRKTRAADSGKDSLEPQGGNQLEVAPSNDAGSATAENTETTGQT